ncbi:MAG: peptidase [Flavipsychrobacter sp.]|nr:peptidase [Flavipsychrobacter sp.]
MTARKIIGKAHLFLGLSSGLIVFIVAITGCLYAFKDEIQNATQPYRFVAKQDKQFLHPSQIQHIAEQALPGKHIHAVMYQGETHAAKAIFYSGPKAGNYYYFVYVNQYTGEVLKVRNEYKTFFRFVLDGHFYLWLPHDLGHVVVASATLVFLTMVISGIVLWWPRNKAGRKQRFSIKLNAKWRRKNYDMHNVLGFYVASLAIVFAVTGSVWGFEWFKKAYYGAITGGRTMIKYKEPASKDAVMATTQLPAIDRIWLQLQKDVPANGTMEVHIPETDSSSIAVNINPDPTTYWKTDYRYFDQNSLRELSVNHVWGRFKDAKGGDKLMRMNYDIHVGAVLGLPGKLLAFFASLIIASMPITGTLIWWGRRKKSKPALHAKTIANRTMIRKGQNLQPAPMRSE